MVLWWIGNVIALVVVIPLVVLLAARLLRMVHEIDRYAGDIRDDATRLAGTLEGLPALAEAEQLTAAARDEAVRYATALRPLLRRH